MICTDSETIAIPLITTQELHTNYRQEGHDGPEVAHLYIISYKDR
jgi:hypothetical protein